ncbi:MAG: JAB-like toxin 1 domain-containing protein [Bacteroidales bacterium]|nr:JAB-like toxin 1 domain-containing protein [Bacteroidales bacterium]MDD4208997.1 JAB-like toxin 1 domain-containing protein [Bacteroidales bacterium]
MNQSYKATLLQYALPPSLPIWGDLEGWSRDPMFEEKPSISPYAYCANNPVLFVDPTGEDEYEFDEFGKITWKAPNDVDIFYKVDNEGNKIDGTTLTLDKKVVTGQITLKGNDGTMVNYLKVTGDDEAKQIFEHLANNSSEAKTEYGLTRIGNQSSERNMIGVNAKHIDGKTAANKVLFQRGYTIREAIHNHPTDDNTISEGDVYIAKMIQDKFPQAKFYNYTTSNSYTPYDKKSIGVNVKITLPACIIKATH